MVLLGVSQAVLRRHLIGQFEDESVRVSAERHGSLRWDGDGVRGLPKTTSFRLLEMPNQVISILHQAESVFGLAYS